eukprot:g23616.t1
MGLWGDEGRVDQGVPEGMVPMEGGQGRGAEYVSGGGISLEVVEMASDDLQDVDTGGMPADKIGAVVVWRTDVYIQRQLSDTSSYLPLDHDPTMTHQTTVSTT